MTFRDGLIVGVVVLAKLMHLGELRAHRIERARGFTTKLSLALDHQPGVVEAQRVTHQQTRIKLGGVQTGFAKGIGQRAACLRDRRLRRQLRHQTLSAASSSA